MTSAVVRTLLPSARPPQGIARLRNALAIQGYRLAASAALPARWFGPSPPALGPAARARHIEIVSHCWRYHHLLECQLASLVEHAPRTVRVTMTVFHAAEDVATCALLDRFANSAVRNVEWRPWPLPPAQLFRRSIGRNLAARATVADWVWFTDCDVVFGAGTFDALADAVVGIRSPLIHPAIEYASPVLEGVPWATDDSAIAGYRIEPSRCTPRQMTRATGPLQIARGEAMRAVGYCASLKAFQQPAPTWCKAHEDRAFRWQLATAGEAVPIPHVFRIRHSAKGRDAGRRRPWRAWLRRLRTGWQDLRRR